MHPSLTVKQSVIIWVWLVALLALALAASFLPAPRGLVLGILFGTAAIKALLVALYYMHLRFAHFAVSLFALIPFLLFIILTLALFPDFLFQR